MLNAPSRSRRSRGFLAALPVALLAAVLVAGPANATTFVKQTGLVGPWSFAETSSVPLVTCNYGPTTDANHYFMTKITVIPPTVYAADRNSAKVDTRHVSWQFQIQRKHDPDGHWVVVGRSAIQRGTAKDNLAAPFTALSLKHNGHHAGLDTAWILRIQVLIKWYKPSGPVEGTVLFRPDYFWITTPDFSGVSSEPYCQEVATSG